MSGGHADIVVGQVAAVLVGCVQPWTRPGTHSAIAKHAVAGRVVVGPLGLAGDAQADTHVHGGPDKAVHCYASEHYTAWQRELGALPLLATPGAFGENLATVGLDETTVCLGDRLRIGDVLFEVAQGRQPCWKLNDRLGVADMARRLQDTLRTGWYLRVVTAGSVAAGDDIVRVARPCPAWPIARLMALLYADGGCLAPALLVEARALALPPSWLKLIDGRLQHGTVEDWHKRLDGPPGI